MTSQCRTSSTLGPLWFSKSRKCIQTNSFLPFIWPSMEKKKLLHLIKSELFEDVPSITSMPILNHKLVSKFIYSSLEVKQTAFHFEQKKKNCILSILKCIDLLIILVFPRSNFLLSNFWFCPSFWDSYEQPQLNMLYFLRNKEHLSQIIQQKKK